MREQQFALSRSQREQLWRRFKQTDDRRIAERLHAILLLDTGRNAQSVCTILTIHSNMLKRWLKTFVAGSEEAFITLNHAPAAGNLTQAQQQQ